MKELVSRVKNFLHNLLGDLLPVLLKNGRVAVKVVDIVKEVVENPLLNLAVSLTPTKKDDIALRKAKMITSELMGKLGFAMRMVESIEMQEDPKVVAKWVSEHLRGYSSDSEKAVFYRELAGLILESLMDDGKISTGEYVAIGQFLFRKRL